MAGAITDASAPAPDGYADSIEHLKAELERLDLLLRRQVERLRRRQPLGEPLAALYISDSEIDAQLSPSNGRPPEQQGETEQRIATALGLISTQITERIAASRKRGITLRLDRLAQRCGLTPLERDILLIALAPDIEPHYQRLYAYLQDDATRRRPGIDFAFDLACEAPDAKLEARRIIAAEAPLRRHRLVALTGEPGDPLPAVDLKVEDGVVDYLLGFEHLDPRIAACARRVTPRRQLGELQLPAAAAERLTALAKAGIPSDKLVLHFQGRYGSGRHATAEALAQAFGVALLVVDGAHVAALAEPEARAVIEVIRRETLLRDVAVFWDGFDAFLDENRRSVLRVLMDSWLGGVVFLAGERAWEPRGGVPLVPFVRVPFPPPSALDRLELWRRALAGVAGTPTDSDLAALANGFRLTGGEIRDAVATAGNVARWRGDGAGVTFAELQAACRLHSSHGLAALGQKIEAHYRWDDLVLPPDRLQQLREIADGIKYRARVLDQWGFGAKLSLGKGLAALFTGASGTGKTMAAEVIAGELGLDLYKIDLSVVVSKFIGETEKNLARIFAEAETSNAILFFDEADALFGKRSEVRDAHDRYANIETAYLLQRLEAYEGLVILATNLKKNMDEAFVRRLQIVIEFPMPAEADRRRMWSGIWPKATPLSADIDFDALARFELAGGSIKNVALAAAFLAAGDGEVVTMTHLLRATQREFQKMGRIIAPGELAIARAAGELRT